jgi:glycosyltransferase involved in cell wall biosynthesis
VFRSYGRLHPLVWRRRVKHASPRVFLLDPGLRVDHGHNYAVSLAVQEECRRRAIPMYLFCDARIDRRGLRSFDSAIPLAASKSARIPEPHRLLVRAAASSTSLCRQLDRYLSPVVAEGDLILVHTIAEDRLPGLARWYSSLPEPRPRLAIVLMGGPRAMFDDEAGAEFARPLLEYGLRLFRNQAGKNAFLLAYGEQLCRYYSDLADLPVEKAPMLIDFPHPLPSSETEGAGRVERHFVYLGRAVAERGFDLLPEAIAMASGRIPGLELTLHALSASSHTLGRFDALGGSIKLIRGALDQREFRDLLGRADFVLAPYDPRRYGPLRPSHSYLEALGSGKPVIAVKGSWLESEAESLRPTCVFAREFRPEAIADAMVEASFRYEELSARAIREAPRVRELHSIQSFMDLVLSKLG